MSNSNPGKQGEESFIVNPARTAVQLVPAAIITEAIDAFAYNMSEKQYAALLGLLLLASSFFQNYIEFKKGKFMFKK